MRLRGLKGNKSKIKMCILEGNEKFEKRKCAYFSPNVREREDPSYT
jgi:hypothetical protein